MPDENNRISSQINVWYGVACQVKDKGDEKSSKIENRFADDEVIFQDDDASCQGAKSVKVFLQERQINSMTVEISSWLKIYGDNLKKKLKKRDYNKAGFILQSWSVSCCSLKFEPLWCLFATKHSIWVNNLQVWWL